MSAIDKAIKEEYIRKIVELLKKIDDSSLLDLVFQILKKSM